jgi:hypothetical protein
MTNAGIHTFCNLTVRIRVVHSFSLLSYGGGGVEGRGEREEGVRLIETGNCLHDM